VQVWLPFAVLFLLQVLLDYEIEFESVADHDHDTILPSQLSSEIRVYGLHLCCTATMVYSILGVGVHRQSGEQVSEFRRLRAPTLRGGESGFWEVPHATAPAFHDEPSSMVHLRESLPPPR
jgi:hypothetical protein